jgi:oxepin-CoA hydrolase/3-oxo-5,6-dehydrosuberyl-CoA semialdehyde dehydrogenase
MMNQYQNYIQGKWVSGDGSELKLYNAINGDVLGDVSSKGIDYKSVLEYGRSVGGPELRKMTFQERGRMLKALAFFLLEKKERYYGVSAWTGATKIDSWIDIEGGIGNLFANASLRKQFPDLPYYVDGVAAPLSKGGSFIGHHIMVPKEGVAIHINAFNFPIWGMLEKIAVNLMAGVPAIVKPSEFTCYLTEVMVRDIIASKILPEGSLQLICGLGRGIIDHVDARDTVTFTGSASTGKVLKGLPQITENSVAFNLEADSLNASILGKQATPGTAEYDLFIKECVKEITIKAGQKCTAVRRIIVPENLIDEVEISIAQRLGKTTIGDPAQEGVRMGALATKIQVDRVRENVDLLAKSQKIVFGDLDGFEVMGADKKLGAFFLSSAF